MLRLHRQQKHCNSANLAQRPASLRGWLSLLLLLPAAITAGQTQFSIGLNAQPLLSHVVKASGSHLSDDFSRSALRQHYSAGASFQLTGNKAFIETAFRYDRQSMLLLEDLGDNGEKRMIRIQYSGASVPLLLGVRIHHSEARRYQLFLLGGGWMRSYQASSAWYGIGVWNKWGRNASFASDRYQAVWRVHDIEVPELGKMQQEFGLEAGFRVRINVKKLGRIEYGLTYEWAETTREGISVDNWYVDMPQQRLIPRMNAFRVNFAYYVYTWGKNGKWQRKRLGGASRKRD